MTDGRPFSQGPAVNSGELPSQGVSQSGPLPAQGFPAGGDVKKIGDLAAARYLGAGSYVTANGNCYVIGGYDTNGNATDTIIEFDPETGASSVVATIPDPPGPLYQNTGAAPGDGFFYSIQGFAPNVKGGSSIPDVYRVDPADWSWTQVLALAEASSLGDCSLQHGKPNTIYHLEGNDTLYIIDTSNDTSTVAGDFGNTIVNPAFIAPGDGYGYRVGGQTGLGDRTNAVDQLEIATGTPTVLESLPVTRTRTSGMHYGEPVMYLPAGDEDGGNVTYISKWERDGTVYTSDSELAYYPDLWQNQMLGVDRENDVYYSMGGRSTQGAETSVFKITPLV